MMIPSLTGDLMTSCQQLSNEDINALIRKVDKYLDYIEFGHEMSDTHDGIKD